MQLIGRDRYPHRAQRPRRPGCRRLPQGIRVSDKQMRRLPLDKHEFHPQWNYTLRPRITSMQFIAGPYCDH